MPKAKTTYPEINEIKDDLESLKTNVVDLTKQIKKNSVAHTNELKKNAMDRIDGLKSTGEKQIKNVEKRVKEKPAHALAAAFAVGVIASMLLKRR